MRNNLLIIGFVWPEPNSTAAGTRMLQIIELFQNKNYTITFVSTAAKNDVSFPLEDLNIRTHIIPLNDASFDTLVKQIDPTIVLFDRFLTEEQFGWRIHENCPNAIRILDTEDLHFLRHARHQEIKNKKQDSLNSLVNDITKREIASIYRCDLSFIISKYEYDLLVDTFKMDAAILLYLPFLIESIDCSLINLYPTFKEREHFMTIGNFRHEPNWNAVLYLKNKIWPLIRRKLPNSQIHVYGAYVSDKVKELHNQKDGFIIMGRAKKAEYAFKKARVCLAPLRFGAGLKGKLIDAMQYGTPSVTTTTGAEAMHDDLPWNGFICDDPDDFALKSIELYSSENYWTICQERGVNIINNCYSVKEYRKKMIRVITDLQKNIVAHRLNNFIGAMLMHHTLQGTKYLSKWIEEKNRPLEN